MTITSSSTETLESLQSTLEPLAALHGQQTQLESWVNDSCQALEKLHGELTGWQNELARKQTDLDLREDALEKCQLQEDELGSQVEQWKANLATAQEESQQFAEENSEQLEQLNQLETRCIELENALKASREQSAELTASLESERDRAAEEQKQWKEEFKGMRELLDKQCTLLATQLQSPSQPSSAAAEVKNEASARSQELRHRAKARLAAKRKQQLNQPVDQQPGEETTES